jgi:hypothetical protein
MPGGVVGSGPVPRAPRDRATSYAEEWQAVGISTPCSALRPRRPFAVGRPEGGSIVRARDEIGVSLSWPHPVACRPPRP